MWWLSGDVTLHHMFNFAPYPPSEKLDFMIFECSLDLWRMIKCNLHNLFLEEKHATHAMRNDDILNGK